MNALGDLLRQRVAELQAQGISMRAQAQRGGWGDPNMLAYYLKRVDPAQQLPRRNVVEQLAAAVDLPPARIWQAAVLSTLPDHPTALQRLLREAQARLGHDTRTLADLAGIHPNYLQRIFNGDHGHLKPETIRGLAHAFRLTQTQIREAAVNETVDYRLPANLASRMTPEKWAEALRVIEAMVSGDDGTSPTR